MHEAAPPPPRLPHHLGALLCDHFTTILSGIPSVSRNVGGSRVLQESRYPSPASVGGPGSVRRQERGLCLWQEQGTARLGHGCSLGLQGEHRSRFTSSLLVLYQIRCSGQLGARHPETPLAQELPPPPQPAVEMDPMEQLRIQAFFWVTGRCCSVLHPLTQL